jgi:putative Holliday junction resolvase
MILGVDIGERRVGVAVADRETRFARPLEVIDVQVEDPIARLAALADDLGADLIVVGTPLTLSGQRGPAARTQADFTARLRAATAAAVEEYDERLTTVVAERLLRSSGASSATRRLVRDAVAALIMLQGYLDAAGRTGP